MFLLRRSLWCHRFVALQPLSPTLNLITWSQRLHIDDEITIIVTYHHLTLIKCQTECNHMPFCLLLTDWKLKLNVLLSAPAVSSSLALYLSSKLYAWNPCWNCWSRCKTWKVKLYKDLAIGIAAAMWTLLTSAILKMYQQIHQCQQCQTYQLYQQYQQKQKMSTMWIIWQMYTMVRLWTISTPTMSTISTISITKMSTVHH